MAQVSAEARSEIRVPIARAFVPLLGRHRYKGAKGGRGGAKSWFFCGRVVEESIGQHIRSVCAREIQLSIKDSVKTLIEDKIHALAERYPKIITVGQGRDFTFDVREQEIRGPNESLFIFRGMQSYSTGRGSATGIKSLEGFNRCFVEEAQTISQRSLDLLYPTFRTPGSQLSFGWNPLKPTDPVDAFFADAAAHNDSDFACVTVNWRDNPWFPEELRKDMERDRRRDPDKYLHVWEGEYLRRSAATVFRNWQIKPMVVPRGVPPRYGADWGFSVDPTVLVRAFIWDRTLYIDAEAYKVGCEIDETPKLFDSIEPDLAHPYHPRKWNIIGDSSRPETISYMRRNGYPKLIQAVKGPGSIEDGIEFMRSHDIVVHPRCKRVIDELTHYSYKIDKQTEEVLGELEDKKNHTIDGCRYAVETFRRTVPKAESGGMTTR